MNDIELIKSIDKRVIAVENKIFALLLSSIGNLILVISILIFK